MFKPNSPLAFFSFPSLSPNPNRAFPKKEKKRKEKKKTHWVIDLCALLLKHELKLRNIHLLLLIHTQKLSLTPQHHSQCPHVLLHLSQSLHLILFLTIKHCRFIPSPKQLLMQAFEARSFPRCFLLVLCNHIQQNHHLHRLRRRRQWLLLHELLHHCG